MREKLAGAPLFSGLPGGDLDELARIVAEKRFGKGETIFHEGEEGAGFYVVITGMVRVFKLSYEGKEQILHVFGPGEPIGEVPVFAGQSFPANAQALMDSTLLFISRADFIDLIKRHPTLALNMLALLSKRLRRFTRLVEDLSLKEVPARLAAYLLSLDEGSDSPGRVRLEITKGHLAALLGTIPETLSRILSKMGRKGLIETEGPFITILDPDGLEELAQGETRLKDLG